MQAQYHIDYWDNVQEANAVVTCVFKGENKTCFINH